jgi:hypothetical protein
MLGSPLPEALSTPFPKGFSAFELVPSYNCAKPGYYHISGFKNDRGWDSETELIPTEGF